MSGPGGGRRGSPPRARRLGGGQKRTGVMAAPVVVSANRLCLAAY